MRFSCAVRGQRSALTLLPPTTAEFKRRVEALFPEPLQENTLHTTFRRAGLLPDKWCSGWAGVKAFHYNQAKRQAYAPTRDKAANLGTIVAGGIPS